jgi:DNA-binding response OmpR family regulator
MRRGNSAEILWRAVRVLVVEDKRKVAKALREGLEAERYVVPIRWSSGEEGFFL